MVDSVILRQVLTAFLPAGGLIDRLGDNRERIRDSAREAMVILGGLAFRTAGSSLQGSLRQKDTGKGPETPYMIWERFFKESGLQSKSAKVREQVCGRLDFNSLPYLAHPFGHVGDPGPSAHTPLSQIIPSPSLSYPTRRFS